MSKNPALRPGQAVGRSLRQAALAILAETRSALEGPAKTDTVAIHDVRKSIKQWRALLRLLPLGDEAQRLRIEARDIARSLGGSRDAQSALDALSDLLEEPQQSSLSARSIESITARLEDIRRSKERRQLNAASRARVAAWVATMEETVNQWPLDEIGFADVAKQLANVYRRARERVPKDWRTAKPEEIHELRQRVVEHRYQMELVEPLWPRLGKTWVDEAQRLRTRLGQYQDLTLLTQLSAPHQPLAPWRSRLSPLIARRQAEHVKAAARMSSRVFAEPPKAFRRRMEALWEAGAAKEAFD